MILISMVVIFTSSFGSLGRAMREICYTYKVNYINISLMHMVLSIRSDKSNPGSFFVSVIRKTYQRVCNQAPFRLC